MSIVRTKRDEAKLTLEELAHLSHIGVFKLGRIERGQSLKLHDAMALARVFNCAVEDFAEETEKAANRNAESEPANVVHE